MASLGKFNTPKRKPKASLTYEEWSAVMEGYHDAPGPMLEWQLDERYWSKQHDIISLALDGPLPRTSIKASNGVGKSFIVARIALAWLMRYPEALVLVVAPKEAILTKITMKEIKKAAQKDYDKMNILGGLYTHLNYKIDDYRSIEGVVASSTENLLGFHSPNILVICDEASGVPQWVFDGIESWLTSGNVRLVMIGNPTQDSGYFYESHTRLSHMFNTASISTFDTPNFTGEKMPPNILAALPKVSWAEDRKKLAEASGHWGAYKWSVLAEFPADNEDSIVRRSKVEEAMARNLPDDHPDVLHGWIRIGCDVARHGSDRTVITMAEGPRVRFLREIKTSDTVDATAILATIAREVYQDLKYTKAKLGRNITQDDIEIIVDATGVGWGVLDPLRRMFQENGERYKVLGFASEEKPVIRENRKLYPLRRDEAWFHFAQTLIEEELDLPDDDVLKQELCAPMVQYRTGGKRKAEGKDRIKKKDRLGRSPDYADSVIILFAPDNPETGLVELT